VQTTDQLQRGRDACIAREWGAAVDALSLADRGGSLEPADLELLATALFMVGRPEEHVKVLERAYQARIRAGELPRAALCAFWIGMRLFFMEEAGRAGGWLARAQHALDQDGGDCVERGYLMVPDMYRAERSGDRETAVAIAARVADVGQRFGDHDLFALATHARGLFLIDSGRVDDGLACLDEAMVAVMSGDVSPMPTGIVYCGAIIGCSRAFDPRRAKEWTDGLHAWCEMQPDMLAFTGDCHLHRAELMQLHGEWAEALAELGRSAERAQRARNARVAAHAAYHRGEIQRLRGDFAAAEASYRDAANGGYEPQPGLALLRSAQGDSAAAIAAARRLLDETTEPAARARLLPACVEVFLAAGAVDDADDVCTDLEALASDRPSDLLVAVAAHARGAVTLARTGARDALPHLRRALAGYQDVGAPYESARVRLLVADACCAMGDEDSAAIERDAARATFATLGVASGPADERDMHGLTAREVEVLRLVAAGHTNKAIADRLVLSERTVDRHVSNIFAKLRVSSRAAATAYAYEHRLV
jgi:DNA-binding NarL/FixJ family response regulator